MKSIIQELSKTKREEINLTLPSEQLEKEVQAYETIKEYLSDGGAEALDAYVDVVSLITTSCSNSPMRLLSKPGLCSAWRL